MITKKQINEIYINITYNILRVDVVISKSNRKYKQLKAVIDNKKTFHFGAAGYTDYAISKMMT